MRATEDILGVWRRFDGFPMETLTKAWYSQFDTPSKQRSVEQMKAHREQYGTSGNCFDLAIWLLDEFRKEKLPCYGILTPDSHVAVVVQNEHGDRYLCDLGDQWIEPILIDPGSDAFVEHYVEGFFPGAQVKCALPEWNELLVTYRRPNGGKESRQVYRLEPISDERLAAEGERTQLTLRNPLVERRLVQDGEVIHWEFDSYASFYSTTKGLRKETKLQTVLEWADRIASRSGIDKQVVKEALDIYAKR